MLQRTIVPLRPNFIICSRVHQLGRDAQLVDFLAHTAFQQVMHAQFAAHLLCLYGFAFVGEGRVAVDHKQARQARERGDYVIGHAVAEVFLLAIAAHVGEGQYGNRGNVGQCQSRTLRRGNRRGGRRRAQGEMLHEYNHDGDEHQSRKREHASPHMLARDSLRPRARTRTCAGFGQDAPHPHWPGNVFHLLLASILVAQRELVSYLLMDSTGDADAAWGGEALEARGDVDPVAVDLFAIDDHVAEVDTDAELHPPLGWDIRVLRLQRGLDFDRALDGVDDAGELRDDAVARRINESPAMLFDQRID